MKTPIVRNRVVPPWVCVWRSLTEVCVSALRPKPHGRQAGRAVGSNWPSPRPSYQTASSGSTGIMTWRVRLRFKDSRGSTLELRVCGHASPLLPNTSAGSDPIVAVVFLGDPSVGLQTCLRGKLRSGFLGSADPRRLAPPIPGSGRGPCLPRLKPSPGLLPPCLPSGEDLNSTATCWCLFYFTMVCNLISCLQYVMATKGRFTLRWRSPPVMNSTRISKFGWPRVTLLSGGSLHYGQESFGGELCTWMKLWHGYQCGDTFLKGEISRGQVCWEIFQASDKKLDLRRTPTRIK